MTIDQLKNSAIVRGAVFKQSVQVIATVPMGLSAIGIFNAAVYPFYAYFNDVSQGN